ncbi:MAG: phage holin family protein [Methyloversatilis discipulorum]|uniref:phage holin family protein n=1 Tax=Methyloversatilis discipulorum TaxID=1119528 RepID=UPI0026F2BBCF|nr:phage holin family protein [Methyloversatilis discipulorum]MBV5285570.1 phage holin family protein [Methyloversatilis discipulorum]
MGQEATGRTGGHAVEDLGQLWRRACSLAADFGLLVALDVRRSARRAVEALCVAVVAAVLFAVAWIAVMAALIGLSAEPRAGWAHGMLGAGAINLSLAIAMAWWVRSRLRRLPLATSIRQLQGIKEGEVTADA